VPRIALLLVLAASPALAAPEARPQPPPETLALWDSWQREAARRAEIDWLLAKAVRIKESFNDAGHVSTTGAVGLMQLMPTSGGRMLVTRNFHRFMQARAEGKRGTAWALAYQRDLQRARDSLPIERLVRLDRRFDPRWNLERGTLHLAGEHHRFRRLYPRASVEDLLRMTLAAYYGGPGRVRFRGGKVLLPSYVKPYVEDALGVHRRLKAGLPGR
jgi:soluble lytic murein transglycosylase-like protein